MKFYEMNTYCNSKNFKSEREFHKYLFNYFKSKELNNLQYEKFYNREIRPDIYFEFENKKYIVECKYISKNFNHTNMADFLLQMFNYRNNLGDDHIYLCAICGDDDILYKKFGDGYLYPISQMFAAFGFYFLKWDKDYPKHFNCEENCFLSYSNGSGIINLTK
jgi:hypothetical protein